METLINKYVNQSLYSDVRPLGRIIGTKGKKTLIIKLVQATKQLKKLDYIIGGFLAHYTNQDEQVWEFIEIDEIIEIRMSKQFNKQYFISDKPQNFYDYNF